MSTFNQILNNITVQEVSGPIEQLGGGKPDAQGLVDNDVFGKANNLAQAGSDTTYDITQPIGSMNKTFNVVDPKLDMNINQLSQYSAKAVYDNIKANIATLGQYLNSLPFELRKVTNTGEMKLEEKPTIQNSKDNPSLGYKTKAYRVFQNREVEFNQVALVGAALVYIANNTHVDAAGNIHDNNATSGALGYDFLARGGVGAYRNHLPSNMDVNGLPGAIAMTRFAQHRIHPIGFGILGEGNVTQTGGGVVISSAPSVAKYCSDSNYLIEELEKKKKQMQAANLSLSPNSQNKLDILINSLKTAERELCKLYHSIDLYIESSKRNDDGKRTNEVVGTSVDFSKLENKKTELQAKRNKYLFKSFSTIMTLDEVIANAVARGMQQPRVPPPPPPPKSLNQQGSVPAF